MSEEMKDQTPAPPRGQGVHEPDGWPYGYTHVVDTFADGNFISRDYVHGTDQVIESAHYRLEVSVEEGDTTNHPLHNKRSENPYTWQVVGGDVEVESEAGRFKVLLYPVVNKEGKRLY